MEKAKLHVKIALCISVVIAATLLIAIAMLSGKVTWQAVAVLITSWWLSLIVMSIVIIDSHEIFGFVKRTVQHQLNGPKGNFPVWLFLVLTFFTVGASAVHMYGKYYVAVIQFGNNFDGIAAAGISVLLLALAKIFGYHRQETKARAKEPVVKHEPISLFA
jgi:hypothetical protein